jgi:hypothetical protein
MLQDLLYRTPIGQEVFGIEGEILKDLVAGHYHADQLVGCGVQTIKVEANAFGYKGFEVVRVDGSQQAWSFHHAIYPPKTGDHDMALAAIRSAFRAEIYDQVSAFKSAVVGKGGRCPVSGKPLLWETTDVDHVQPFAELLQEFLQEIGVSMPSVEVQQIQGGLAGAYKLSNQAFAQRWREWHQRKAVFQALWRDAHRCKEGHQIQPLDETRLTGSRKRYQICNPDEDLSDLF